jgi:hypothetical protein
MVWYFATDLGDCPLHYCWGNVAMKYIACLVGVAVATCGLALGAAGGSTGASKSIRMTQLVPDPVGSDIQLESITIGNFTSGPIDMVGWVVKDKSGKIWLLGKLGVIAAGNSKTITRQGQAMSLNNDGDTIELLDRNKKSKDKITYGKVKEGEVVQPIVINWPGKGA